MGFLFFTRNLTKKTKKTLKIQKTRCVFRISVGKQKTLGKPKSFGPLRNWFFGFHRRNVWSLEMFLACEYRHINIKAGMSRHDVVKRHDFASGMKSKEKLSSMKSMRFDGIYNGKEAEVGQGGGGCPYIYMYIYISYIPTYLHTYMHECACVYS